MSSVGVAVIGAGPWGLNVARAFAVVPGVELRWLCDVAPDRLARGSAVHPRARAARALTEVLADPEVDAVAVAVDSPRHHEVARQVLLAGRHVLVEKPMALSLADASELCALARERSRVLMVGHVLLHHPAVLHARELIAAGALGQVLYLHAARVAFGTVRPNESAWWSVAPHDIAVALHLLDAVPVTVSATAGSFLQPEHPDIAFGTLRFGDGRLAHVHVSWLAPAKHRALTVVGTRRMLTFDETSDDRPLLVHDRAIEAAPGGGGNGFVGRAGGVEAPAFDRVEPLVAECEHFVACVLGRKQPRSDGPHALDVIRVLEAGQRSMRAGGVPVEVA